MKSKLLVRGNEINRNEMLKADSYEELIEKMKFRVERKYPKSKVLWAWQIQSTFLNYDVSTDESYSDLIKKLKFTIEAKARGLERKYKNVRLSYHDFEAELWKATYEAAEYYEQSGDIDTEFTLLETLEMFWATRIKSFIRSCLYTKKHSIWYTASSLSDDFGEFWKDESPNPEQQYLLMETVQEMLGDSTLTIQEKHLLEIIYEFPNGSLREWGKEMNISHPQKVKRVFNSLQKKLQKYQPII